MIINEENSNLMLNQHKDSKNNDEYVILKNQLFNPSLCRADTCTDQNVVSIDGRRVHLSAKHISIADETAPYTPLSITMHHDYTLGQLFVPELQSHEHHLCMQNAR